MEMHLFSIVSEALEFLYVLLPVVSLAVLAYKLASETGKRTGSSLLFFSAVIYFIGVYESFYISSEFGLITNTELILLQPIYLIGGFLLFFGSFSLYNFFIRITEIGNSKKALRTTLFIILIYLLLFVPYFLTQSYDKPLYVFNDVFYVLIQAQFFASYFIFGYTMYTNKIVCEKASKRSKQIKFVSFYYLAEPILWLWLLNSKVSEATLDRVFLITEIIGAVVAGFLTFNILHMLVSHAPLVLDRYKARYFAIAKSAFVRQLTIMAIFVGVTLILAGTLATEIFFKLQKENFNAKIKDELNIISAFAKEGEREIESLTMRVKLLTKENLKIEKLRDTIRSLRERYSEYVSNVFIFDKDGKIYYSYPEVVRAKIPFESFSPHHTSVSLLARDEKGHFRLYIFFPRFDEEVKIFSGGVGIELNFDNLREKLKKALTPKSNVFLIDTSNLIISSDDEKKLGQNFLMYLNSIVDQPESISSILSEFKDINKAQTFTTRLYKNSRRTFFAITVAPVNFNGNKVVVCDYHFLEDFASFEMISRSEFLWLIVSALGIIISVVAVLYLNFKFSEHLENEVENRTIELLKSEEKYRTIVENPFFGAYLMDESGFKYVNDKFCEIFGYTKEEILNLKDYSILVHPDDRERLNQQLRRRLRGEIDINKWSARGLRKDGQEIFIEGYSNRVEYEGKPAVQGMIIDVTEEKKRQEALQRSQKLEALGTLASGIAHDFNNILQIIIGAGQLLEMKLKNLGPEYAKWLKTINSTALRGAELAKRLLLFSRKKPTGELKPIDIHQLIDESVRVFKETFPRNIEIIADFEAQNYTILGEDAQVQQIIFNLAVNAKDAMPNGGKLIFKTQNIFYDEVEYLVLNVIDTGIGMTEEVKRRLFEPFFTTKPAGKGTGLGLSTVYGIVNSYGGFIKVYSEVGKGTKFSVYLPAHKQTAEEKDKSKVRIKKTGTLLLIDDEEEIRVTTKELLEAEGFKVYIAGDGMEGVNIYKDHKDEIDLVILDLNMPKMSGKETLAQLLLINPNVKVIIATGFIAESEKEEVEGVTGFVEKPFNIDKLIQMISTII